MHIDVTVTFRVTFCSIRACYTFWRSRCSPATINTIPFSEIAHDMREITHAMLPQLVTAFKLMT